MTADLPPIATSFLGRLVPFVSTPRAVGKADDKLRVGILGAARIAPGACIKAIAPLAGATVEGIAARDKVRAEAMAHKYGIPKVFGSYEELLASPDIDVVYIPSPNGLHHQHVLMVFKAGKHIMCEKPLTSNAAEAAELAQLSKETDKVAMEAFHYRYHPATQRAKEIVDSDEIGPLKSVNVYLSIPGMAFGADDIRFNYGLAGGTLMDLGCYAVNHLRYYIGTEPVEVTSVNMEKSTVDPQVDFATTAELKFPNAKKADSFVNGKMHANLNGSLFGFGLNLTVEGENGTLELSNCLMPSITHSIKVTNHKTRQTRKESQFGTGHLQGATTYTYMWQAFVDAVKDKKPFPSTFEDAVKNMAVIDSIYTKAGLKIRGLKEPATTAVASQ